MPVSLDEILAPLAPRDAERIAAAIRLVNLQALGSERYREEVQCWTKDDKSPVTVADLLHQTMVQHLLHERFPEDGMICEESPAMQEQVLDEAVGVARKHYGIELRREIVTVPERGSITWMLDPIDGTKGYLAGRYYAIAIGYYHGDQPAFGAMAVPHAPRAEPTRIDNAIAFAVRGVGAWMGQVSEDGEPQFERLVAENAAIEPPFRVALSLEHGGSTGKAAEASALKTVKLDSQAKYLAVAANEIDAYLRQCRNDGGTDATWDHMPGALIALEAGCDVGSFDFSPVEFLPDPVVRFQRGMVCYRGGRQGAVAEAIERLLSTTG